jgi:hypothetical protein
MTMFEKPWPAESVARLSRGRLPIATQYLLNPPRLARKGMAHLAVTWVKDPHGVLRTN